MELLIFICVGIFTGLSAGLLGLGGGIISVPAMVILLPYFDVPPHLIMHIAIATSLALIIPTSLLSAYTHSRQNAIDWAYVIRLVPGLIFGSVIGAYTVVLFDREMLQGLFSAFLILVVMYMLFGRVPKARYSLNQGAQAAWIARASHFLPASLVGLISSLMGVGGGTMTVPYLIWRGVSLPKAIGTSAFCGLPIAVSSSVVFFGFQISNSGGEENSFFYLPAFVGILIGAMVFTPIGAKLTHKINVALLKRLFLMMLLIVAIKLLISYL